MCDNTSIGQSNARALARLHIRKHAHTQTAFTRSIFRDRNDPIVICTDYIHNKPINTLFSVLYIAPNFYKTKLNCILCMRQKSDIANQPYQLIIFVLITAARTHIWPSSRAPHRWNPSENESLIGLD